MNIGRLKAWAIIGGLILPILGSGSIVTGHGAEAAAHDLGLPGIVIVSNRTALPGSLAVFEGQIAFASPAADDASAEILVVDTLAENARTVARIPVAPARLHIDSLDYDGRFLAWSDDRGGALQVHLVDTQDGTFRAITHSRTDERQVRLSNGTLVWTSWGNSSIAAIDLVTGRRERVSGGGNVGPASGPDVFGSRIVWSRHTGGTNFDIFIREPDAEPRRLTHDLLVQARPRLWNGHVIWAEGPVPSPVNPSPGVRIALADLDANKTKLLAPNLGPHKDPIVAGRHAAWIVHQQGFIIYDIVAEVWIGVPLPTGGVKDIDLSPELLAFTFGGQSGIHVYAGDLARLLGDLSSPADRGIAIAWPLLGAGLLLIAGGVAAGRWKGRTRKP